MADVGFYLTISGLGLTTIGAILFAAALIASDHEITEASQVQQAPDPFGEPVPPTFMPNDALIAILRRNRRLFKLGLFPFMFGFVVQALGVLFAYLGSSSNQAS